MSIISIQSHVVYGYVGNKAAVYPLQNMGYDVLPINTVQFSNHTGYGKWTGDIYSGESIKTLIKGLVELGFHEKVQAIVSGYMGSADICEAVYSVVKLLKESNPNILYLCDPVIGKTNCFVKPEVSDFFKQNLKADVITPSHFEAEFFSGIKITNNASLKQASDYFHNKGNKVVIITGIKFDDGKIRIAMSVNEKIYIIESTDFQLKTPVNGAGDLFSATFLGSYLKTNDYATALQHSVYFMESVLETNKKLEIRELQVLSVDYKNVDSLKLKPITVI